MFDTADYDALCAGLDCYPVPMFAAERLSHDLPFRLLCVNAAHTRATGLQTRDIHQVRPLDVLSLEEGTAVEAHYQACADSGEITQYREALHFHGRLTHWETTLLPVDMPDGSDRVIGTALTLGVPVIPEPISDTEFYAAKAQQTLGHIAQFLEILQDRKDIPDDIRSGAQMVAGLNRSVDHLLQELRLASQKRSDDPKPPPVDLRLIN